MDTANAQANKTSPGNALPKEQVLPLLQCLAGWGNTTTVLQHAGCVFEFKGPFPAGGIAEGYYNLEGTTPGFHGHLKLDAMQRVLFQERAHRGRASYAFVFENFAGETLFKVFLGRDESGEVIVAQLEEFSRIRKQLTVS